MKGIHMSSVLTMLFRELAIGMTFSLISVLFILGFALFMKYREEKENKLLIGASLLFMFLGISKAMFLYFNFYLTGFSITLIEQYSVILKFAGAIRVAGFISLIAFAEKIIFKGKTYYLISIFLGISTVIAFTLPIISLVQLLFGVFSIFAMLFIPVSYLYLAIISAEDIRRKALAIFAGFIIYAIGSLIINEVSWDLIQIFITIDPLLLRYFTEFLSVFIKFSAISLFTYGYLKK